MNRKRLPGSDNELSVRSIHLSDQLLAWTRFDWRGLRQLMKKDLLDLAKLHFDGISTYRIIHKDWQRWF